MTGLTAILILLLVGAPVIDWIVAIILVQAARRSPSVRALRERALLAVGLAVTTSLFLVTVFNAELGRPLWSDETGRVLVRLLVAAIGLLPLYWLWLFVSKGFRDTPDR